MAKPSLGDLQKHTLNLRRGDMEKLRVLYPGQEPSVVLRRIVSGFIDKALRRGAQAASMPQVDINLDLE